MLNFVVIPDAHLQTDSDHFVPETIEKINALEIQPDFVMSLGDSVYGAAHHQVLQDVRRYAGFVSRLRAPHYYTIGNHECTPVEEYGLLTWEQLLDAWGMSSRWYSFDIKGFHICVVDNWSGLQADLLERQWEWLRRDLAASRGPIVIFAHEALGFQTGDCQHWIDTANRAFWPAGNEFERIFESHSDRIAGVFTAHKHRSLHKTLAGVTYHTLAANFRNGQFAQVFMDSDGGWFVQGHPEFASQSPEFDLQQTYGDRSLPAAWDDAVA